MTTLAIRRAHWLLISISMSVRPVSSFFPPTWAIAQLDVNMFLGVA
jgi:hypothetical protein